MNRALTGFVSALAIAAALFGLYPLVKSGAQTRRSEAVRMPETTTFRVLLGVGDAHPTAWDGNVKLTGGRVVSIRGWRFAGDDSSDYKSSWKAATRSGIASAAARRAGLPGPVYENGVLIGALLDSPAARFEIETKEGSFSFTAQELPYGETKSVLSGRAVIDRVPSSVQLTTSAEEEDFPAVAQRGEDVYVAYVEFTHSDRAKETRGMTGPEPLTFDDLARPAGGDRVMLQHYSRTRNVWDAPMPVSAAKQDIMKTAVAADGGGRVWVFWSANQNGNFDIYAKSLAGGKWSSTMRLTTNPGTDVDPVAVADSKGRVWVAWQAFRDNNLEVLVSTQSGVRFTPEKTVSFSPASDWDPALAASANGEVAISWDTYDKGDYDVYFRRMRASAGIQMDEPVPVAASQGFEARAAIAYDPRNRLWVAYEASSKKWGKDFGAYETTGVALYQGHNIQVKCFEADKPFTTVEDVKTALPGPMPALLRLPRRPRSAQPDAPKAPVSGEMPIPELASERIEGATPQPPPLPLNSFPRIAVDSRGTVYLAFRTVASAWRSPAGTVWFENVIYFDGARWNGPIFVPRTDGLLDNRPGMAVLAPGHVMLISAMDHRQSQVVGGGRRGGEGINSDVYAADLRIDLQPQTAKLRALPPETVAAPQPDAKPEQEQVAMLRKYRAALPSGKFQLLRGEFHRHTEISGDGGRDGPLIDAYRYFIDAAAMDWGGCCDHMNGGGEYTWWREQKLTDAYRLGHSFLPMFSYERSARYPEGHRNAVFATRGIRPLPLLPTMKPDSPAAPAPDTQMLYKYLRRFDGIVASHTSGTDMGTDWRDNDPVVEPVVEIYQGDRHNYEMPGAPRANSEADSIGGWRPLGFVSLALRKGYRLGFQASSDHISTHMSYCNLWVTAPTREAIMEAFHKRRVYGATDNILADVRSGGHFMGEEFTTEEPPSISVKLQGTANFAKVQIIKDNEYVYSVQPGTAAVNFTWKDSAAEKGKTSYYYVRGEQSDGELVWASPMWITYR